jgi:hypothetical protein
MGTSFGHYEMVLIKGEVKILITSFGSKKDTKTELNWIHATAIVASLFEVGMYFLHLVGALSSFVNVVIVVTGLHAVRTQRKAHPSNSGNIAQKTAKQLTQQVS